MYKKIYDNGGISCEHLTGKGKVIFAQEPNKEIVEKLKKRGLGVITLDEILEIVK